MDELYKGDGKVQQSQSFEEKGALAGLSNGKLEPSASFVAWIQSFIQQIQFLSIGALLSTHRNPRKSEKPLFLGAPLSVEKKMEYVHRRHFKSKTGYSKCKITSLCSSLVLNRKADFPF